jgi:hypothetical protein
MDLYNDHSATSLVTAMMRNHPEMRSRPMEVFHAVFLYKIFGLHPLGYHVVNTAILVGISILFYLCLLQIQLSRIFALSAALVYIMLPHYSTNRFWMTASVVPLSVGFYFVSLYCDLRAIRAQRWRFALWKTAGSSAVLASTLAYETTLPLFLINPLLVRHRAKRYWAESVHKRENFLKALVLYGSVPILIVLVFVFKIIVNQRSEAPTGNLVHYLIRYAYQIVKPASLSEHDFGFNIWHYIRVDIFDRGLKLPLLAVDSVMRQYNDWPQVVCTGAIGILVFLYLYRAASTESDWLLHPRNWGQIVGAGLLVSLAGYAIFFVVPNILFTVAGAGNRVSMSAAVGIALVLVGVTGWAVAYISAEYLRRVGFALVVALLVGSGCLVNYAIGSFWTAAFQRETTILAAIHGHFRTIPEGSALLLDGVCPYVGPAIVFESSWDLRGALSLLYRDPTLRADIVTPTLKITQDGLETTIYSKKTKYHYGPDLIIYNMPRDMDRRINVRKDAEDYFANRGTNLPADCYSGHAGVGVPIF